MTEQIKYEAVFGDQSLLEKESDDVVAVRFNDYTNRCYPITKDKLLSLTFTDLKVIPIVALRRVIHVPTWTRADHKAGKLPPIGAKHGFNGLGGVFACLFVDCDGYVWSSGDDNQIYCSSDYELQPIETDAERQQREREEWCDKASGLLVSHPSRDYGIKMSNVYDALLSGELKMPEVKK